MWRVIVNINPLKMLKKAFTTPSSVPAATVVDLSKTNLSDEDKQMLRRIGFTAKELKKQIQDSSQISFERQAIYKDIDRALSHWMMGGAVELFADVATTYSSLHDATVWVSGSKKYELELNKLLNRIGIEEKIFDWAWTTGAYGDLIVKVESEPGLGIISIEDGDHPILISRVDYRGALIGFFRTPLGYAAEERELLPPWEYIHFRLLGAKRKRPLYSDPMSSEFRDIRLLSPDPRRVNSNYGTSLLLNGLGAWKRLRMAEDSLLLARLTRGVLRYIYKVKVDSRNMEAVNEIIDEVSATLKQARALNTDSSDPNFDSKFNPVSATEDIILPVWGDVNDVAVEKVGGEVDIRWIVDIEELRNQLSSAIRTPLSLLGGFVEGASGALGSEAISQLDIRFSRSARRLQRAIKEGIKRLCQIHLAYIGLDPNPELFDIHMSETSSAEEEELKAALDTGTDVVAKFMDMIDGLDTPVDKVGILGVLSDKILKLGDIDLLSYIGSNSGGSLKDSIKESLKEVKRKKVITNIDLNAWTIRNIKEWKDRYGECKISIKEQKEL